MSLDIQPPEWLDWDIWRVLSSPKYSVSLHEMEEHWSILDLQKANFTLDILEELDYRIAKNRSNASQQNK